MRHVFSTESLACLQAFPTGLPVERSTSIGWGSLLAHYYHHLVGPAEHYDTLSTPDQVIALFTKGALTFEVFRARRWHQVNCRAGSVRIRSPHQSERVRPHFHNGKEYSEGFHLVVPQGTMLEAADHLRRPGQRSPVVSMLGTASNDEALPAFALAILVAMRAGYPNLYAEASAQWLAVHLLTSHVARVGDDTRRPPSFISDARLARVLDYIDANLTADLDLRAMASEAGVSKFHFIRLFREKVGETPVQYLMSQRLSRAAQMLLRTDIAINQVALDCGYANVTHFNRRFLRRFGKSPGAYRRGHSAS